MRLFRLECKRIIASKQFVFGLVIALFFSITVTTIGIVDAGNDKQTTEDNEIASLFGVVIDDAFRAEYWKRLTRKPEFTSFIPLYSDLTNDFLNSSCSYLEAKEAVNNIKMLDAYGNVSLDGTQKLVLSNFIDLLNNYEEIIGTDNDDLGDESKDYFFSNKQKKGVEDIWKKVTIVAVLYSLFVLISNTEFEKKDALVLISCGNSKRRKIKSLTQLFFCLFGGVLFTLIPVIVYYYVAEASLFGSVRIINFLVERSFLSIICNKLTFSGYIALLIINTFYIQLIISLLFRIYLDLLHNDYIAFSLLFISVIAMMFASFVFYIKGKSYLDFSPFSPLCDAENGIPYSIYILAIKASILVALLVISFFTIQSNNGNKKSARHRGDRS